MIPFWQPQREYFKYKKEIDEAIESVLSSGKLVLGYSDEITNFEKWFANFIGAEHAVMCGGGTHALKLAYKALDIGPGDEVITTSHTFIATIDQIVDCGATPVLVDIGDDGLIDPDLIEDAINERTKLIVPVHLEGKVCNMDKILEIAKRYGIPVVEDSAQAIGAKGVGKALMACFSMFPAKALGSIGNAGMVTTDDEVLAEHLRMLRCNYNIGKNQDLEHATWGVQLEPDAIQAAVLNVKAKYFPERLLRRKEIADMYYEGLKDLPIILPLKQEGRIYQDFVIRVPENKEALVKYLKDNGIGILGHNLIPNHYYPRLELNFDLPKSSDYVLKQIRIPCNPDLTNEEVNEVIKVIRSFYEK